MQGYQFSISRDCSNLKVQLPDRKQPECRSKSYVQNLAMINLLSITKRCRLGQSKANLMEIFKIEKKKTRYFVPILFNMDKP